jgi:peptide/nickel transport system permease protein
VDSGVQAQVGGALRVTRPLPQRVGRGVWRFVRRYPLGAFGAALVILLLAMAVYPALFTTHPLTPTDPSQAIRDRLLGPSVSHWFGTDQLGRDLYTRIVYGARTAIMIGFGVVLVSAVLAVVLGIVSGYFGGWFDTLFQRLIDIGITLPGLIFIILFITSFQGMPGGVMMPIILSLGVLIAFSQSRVIRSGAISVKEEQYVDAAHALGAGHLRIMWRHIFPNVFAIILVSASLQVGGAILIAAALSFLGYGVQEPTPSWGRMLNDARQLMVRAPHTAVFPGLAIFFAVFSFNMLGDAIRDILDPRLRGT